MVQPYLKQVQLKETIFVQDHTLAVFISFSRFDKVLKKKSDGSFSPAYDDLETAKQDCEDLQECLKKYNITDQNDIYRLDDPTNK